MSLTDQARSSVVWVTGFNLFRDVVQFAVMLVLVRLLTADEYGQFGVLSNVIGFIGVFAFKNFLEHSLQVRNPQEVSFQSHYAFGLVIQVSLLMMTWCIALIASFTESYQSLAIPMAVLSLSFLLDLPHEVQKKIFEKALDWRRLCVLQGVGLLVSACTGILMALNGWGVYALIVPGLLSTLPVIGYFMVRRDWPLTYKLDYRSFLPVIHFGLVRMVSGVLIRGRLLLESIVMMELLGYAEVGNFGRVVGLGVFFVAKFSDQLMYAIYPVLTRIEPSDETFIRAADRIVTVVSWYAIPVALLFAITAEPLVNTVYGDGWTQIIPLIAPAFVAFAANAITHSLYSTVLAANQQKLCQMLDFLNLLVTFVAIAWFLPMGLVVYVYAYAVVAVVVLLATFIVACVKRVVHPVAVVGSLAQSAFATLFAFGVTAFAFVWVDRLPETLFESVVFGTLSLLLYVAMLRLIAPNKLKEIANNLPGSHLIRKIMVLGD